MSQTQLPGTLYISKGEANPCGVRDAEVYLCRGDATLGAITRVIPDEGVKMPPSRLPLPNPVRLKLLHFNDLHGRISCFTAHGHLPVFSRMVSYIHAARARYEYDEQVVVLAASIGDEIGGAIFDELLGDSPDTYKCHAGYRLYSKAGIDIGVLGNHDFDRGTSLLAHAINQEVAFPILAANVSSNHALAASCFPAAIFVARGIRVGFIGLVTPAHIHQEPEAVQHIAHPVKTVLNLIPAIRPLCDVLIILSHLGLSLDQQSAVVSLAGDVELARSLPPGVVHLIIGGHTHNILNEKGLSAENIVNDIPIVQAGKLGQYIGEVDITVQKTASVTYVRLNATADLPVDDTFERTYVQPVLELALAYWNRIIGDVAEDKHLSTDAVRNEFAAGESVLANFITDALVAQCRARGYPVDFAMIDASNVRSGLQVGGKVTFGDWFDLMPFADTLCFMHLSGRQVLALLQDNALRIDRPNKAHTERGFLHFSAQIRYAIDLGHQRAESTTTDIEVNGRPMEYVLDRMYLVATSNFLRGPAASWEAGAGEKFSQPLMDIRQLEQQHTHIYLRDLLVDHLIAHGGVLAEGGAKLDGRLKIISPATTTS